MREYANAHNLWAIILHKHCGDENENISMMFAITRSDESLNDNIENISRLSFDSLLSLTFNNHMMRFAFRNLHSTAIRTHVTHYWINITINILRDRIASIVSLKPVVIKVNLSNKWDPNFKLFRFKLLKI